MSVKFNLSVDQGADFMRTFTVYDGANIIKNLTGCTISGRLKKSILGSNASAIPFVITIIDYVGGKVKMELSHLTTQSLSVGRYVYDVELTNTDTKLYRLVDGTITVNGNI